MSVIAFENWSLRQSILNAWVEPNTHEALQKIMPQYHTEQKNWGAPSMKGTYFSNIQFLLIMVLSHVQR